MSITSSVDGVDDGTSPSARDARAALAESEARYRHLVETASDGIYRISLHGYFIYANPIANRVLGDGNSLIGHHYLEHIREDYHADIQQFYAAQVVQRIPSTYYEFPAVSRSGIETWIGQRVQLEVDEYGTVTGLHAVARDISDRKRLEDALRQSDKMRVVGQLAGGIAHDFNSLVTAICGYSDLLIEALGPRDPRTADAVEIRRAADKAAQLTSQLLTFSRREMFRVRLVNINALIADVRPMLLQLLGPTVIMSTAFDEKVGEVRADTAQLEQALFNITLNARDAMPSGGEFVLRTDAVRIAPGQLSELNLFPGPYVRITLHDTGIGMDDATRAKIFEPFFSTKPPRLGAGLGLATTFGIVSQIGGRIAVESTPGKGTTFRLFLPQAQDRSAAAEPPPAATPSQDGGTVLLVDDEDGIRNVLTRVLETHGMHVIAASNGVDALAKVDAHPGAIDVLLTDVLMPKMGGVDLAEAFLHRHPRGRVIFMSGYAEDPDLQSRPHLAHASLLSKPFDSTTMLTAVRNAIGQLTVQR